MCQQVGSVCWHPIAGALQMEALLFICANALLSALREGSCNHFSQAQTSMQLAEVSLVTVTLQTHHLQDLV